jgi:prolyl 4-hydroxylase
MNAAVAEIYKKPELIANIPRLTRAGFKRMLFAPHLVEAMQQFHRDTPQVPEARDWHLVGLNDDHNPCLMQTLPEDLKVQIHQSIQPVAEEWSGRKITPTYVYGIRTYVRGASLRMHRDRNQGTHVVSAIINVAQQCDQPWLLHLEAPDHGLFHLSMRPGELLLYEGARLLHGRPDPLEGDSYSNCFVHYALVD